MKKNSLFIFALLFPFYIQAQQYHALIINISAYSDSLYSLSYPVKNADKICHTLSRINIEYTLLTNREATTENITNKLDSICNIATEKDYIILYFSGHGIGELLISHDGICTTRNISFTEIQTKLNASKAKEKFCFIDVYPLGGYVKHNKQYDFPTKSDSIFCIIQQRNKYQHGQYGIKENYEYFTTAICTAFLGFADKNKDRQTTVDEFFNYVQSIMKKTSSFNLDIKTGETTYTSVPYILGPNHKFGTTVFYPLKK